MDFFSGYHYVECNNNGDMGTTEAGKPSCVLHFKNVPKVISKVGLELK